VYARKLSGIADIPCQGFWTNFLLHVRAMRAISAREKN
jgi:hypothetical protein